jgi:mannose-6-phosphate isomerase-like protein (cupin superfamily)
MADEVVVRSPDEGAALWMLGGLYEVKATSKETDGGMTAMQMTIPVGMGPPPHVHNCAEAVYVIEGTARFDIDGRTVEAGPGTFFYFPEGTLETFEPTSQVRLLMIYAPGGMDEFFAEAGEPATAREVPPAPEGPPDLERLAAIAAKHGLELREPQTA